MATSKSFFGKRRGSTKNFTFAVFNGKQVTKEKAEQVKNPRTLAQMRNRMVLTTSSAAYAAMKEIVDHSFQGYTYGLQNMSRFQSVNNKLLRAAIQAGDTEHFAYANYGDARLLPGHYIVSEGSLASLPAGMLVPGATGAGVTTIALPIALDAADFTANNVLDKVGISVGGMATVLIVWKNTVTNLWQFGFVRFMSLKAGDVLLTNDNFLDYFQIEASIPCRVGAFASNLINIVATTEYSGADTIPGYAVIHSELVNGVWQRSNETLEFFGNVFTPSAADAILTYPIGGSYVLNGGDVPNGYDGDMPSPEP